jgi:hypothetical protein
VHLLRDRCQSLWTDQSCPAVADQRAGHTGCDREREEEQGVEATCGDQEPGSDQHDLARGKGQRNAGLFGKKESGEQGQGGDTMKTLDEAHLVLEWTRPTL